MARREISERCYKSDQSWNYEWTGVINKHKFQVRLRRNAYDFQSYARVFIWDATSLQWNQIIDAPITECDCASVSYVQSNIKAGRFHQDRDRLLNEAIDIAAEPECELDAVRNLLTALDDPEFQVLRWGPVEASLSRLKALFQDKPELEEIVPIEDDGRPPKHHQV